MLSGRARCCCDDDLEEQAIPLQPEGTSNKTFKPVPDPMERHKDDAKEPEQLCDFETFRKMASQDEVFSEDEDFLEQPWKRRKPNVQDPRPSQAQGSNLLWT